MRTRPLRALTAILLLCALSGCSRHTAERHVDRKHHATVAYPFNDPIRRVYPYSLIPGGVNSVAAFGNFRVSDNVLLQHFRDMGPNIRTTSLAQNKWMYTSYRVADSVFWTKTRVLVRAGEPLLTDGNSLVRGRCGNRLSDLPARPVQAFQPPSVTTDDFTTEAAMVMPPDLTPQFGAPLPVDFPEVAPPVPVDSPYIPGPPTDSGGGIPPIPVPLQPDTGGGLPFPLPPFIPIPIPGPHTHRVPPAPPVAPVILTPELSTWALMLTGLLGVGLASAYRRRAGPFK